MGRTVRTVLVVVVALGLTTGCQMIGWLIGVAAKALPYLIFFAEASPDPGRSLDPALDPLEVEKQVDLALRRAREANDPLPSALDLVSVRFPDGDRRFEIHALQVTPESTPGPYLDLLVELSRHGARPRIFAADAGPLLEFPPTGVRFPIRSADGPLAALVRPDRD